MPTAVKIVSEHETLMFSYFYRYGDEENSCFLTHMNIPRGKSMFKLFKLSFVELRYCYIKILLFFIPGFGFVPSKGIFFCCYAFAAAVIQSVSRPKIWMEISENC